MLYSEMNSPTDIQRVKLELFVIYLVLQSFDKYEPAEKICDGINALFNRFPYVSDEYKSEQFNEFVSMMGDIFNKFERDGIDENSPKCSILV